VILAGDVGGTKTLLGLFERAEPRPRLAVSRAYLTSAFRGFTDILETFLRDVQSPANIHAVAAGVAGPVLGDAATLTNIPWDVNCGEIALCVGTPRVRLINDLEAMATSVDLLGPDELFVLQEGTPRVDGNAVVIAAGTGLGEAYLRRAEGKLRPAPSEGGHADFAARTDEEMELVRMLRRDYGRAEVEHVLCGPGLLNLHRFTHRDTPCASIRGVTPADMPTAVSDAALRASCPGCVKALSMFVSAYGAEAGNLGLRGVATSGVYIGGGIAPKILPALEDGRFMDAFRAKGSTAALVSAMPVKVILNLEAALLGAAVVAQEL
jgi:glucokinase